MWMRSGFVGVLLSVWAVLPQGSYAEQRRDWFVSGPRDEGTYLTGDFLLGVFRGTLAHEIQIFGNSNQLTLFGSGTAALPFGTAEAGFDLRIIALSVGASAGVTRTWRGLACDPGQVCSRRVRREKNASGDFTEATVNFGEARVQGFLPFNEYVTGVGQAAYYVSDAPDRMFDYANGIVHDGEFLRVNLMLFLKHRDWGAFAPTLQIFHFPVDGDRHTQINTGFTALTRAGLIVKDDLFLLQMLFHDPGVTGGYDNEQVYGSHIWRGPFTLTLAYRAQLAL